MASRRSYNSRRSSGPRRRLFWARATNLETYTEANQANRFNLLAPFQAAYGADLFGFTVTRIVGYYTWFTSDSPTVSTTYNLSVGIRKDEQSDVNTGDTQQQNVLPVNSPFDDWMYVRNNLGSTADASGTNTNVQIAQNRVELDLHSQRRLDELGQSLYFFHGLNAYPGADVTAWWDFNILCKRP